MEIKLLLKTLTRIQVGSKVNQDGNLVRSDWQNLSIIMKALGYDETSCDTFQHFKDNIEISFDDMGNYYDCFVFTDGKQLCQIKVRK